MRQLHACVRLVMIVVATLSAILLTLLGAFQTDLVKKPVLNWLVNRFEAETGYHLQVGEVTGFIPFSIQLQHLAVSKDETTLLKFDEAHLSIDLMQMVWGQVGIRSLVLTNIQSNEPFLKDAKLDLHLQAAGSQHEVTFIVSKALGRRPLVLTGTSHLNLNEAVAKLSTGEIPNLDGNFSLSTTVFRIDPKKMNVQGAFNLNSKGDILLHELSGAIDSDHPTTLNGTVFLTDKGSQVNGKIVLKVDDLSVWENNLKIPLAGSLLVESDIAGPLETPLIHLQLHGKELRVSKCNFPHVSALSKLCNQPDCCEGTLQMDGVIAEYPLSSSAEIHWDKLGTLKVPAMKLTLAGGTLEGKLTLDVANKVIDGQFHTELEDVGMIPVPLLQEHRVHGKLRLVSTITGPLIAPVINLESFGERIQVGEHQIDQLNFKTALVLEDDHIHGHLQSDCVWGNIPVDCSMGFAVKHDHSVYLHDIHVNSLANQLTGHLKFDLMTRLIQGDLSGTLGDAQELLRLAGVEGQGAFAFTASFNDLNLQQNVVFRLNGNQLHYKEWSCESCLLHVEAKELYQTPHIAVNAAIAQAANGPIKWKQIHFSSAASDLQGMWPFSLNATGDLLGPFEGTLSGLWSVKPDQLQARIEVLQGMFTGQKFALEEPFTVDYRKDRFELSPLYLDLDRGGVEGKLSFTPEQIDLQLMAENIPLSLVNLVATKPVPVEGTISVTAAVTGTPENPRGHLNVSLEKVSVKNVDVFSELPPANGNLQASVENNALNFNGTLENLSRKPFKVQGTLPLELSVNPFRLKLDLDAPFHATMNAEGEIGYLLKLVFNKSTILTGVMKCGIQASGTLNDPKFSGKAAFDNGSYESLMAGTVFQNMQGEFEGDHRRIVLKHMTGDDAGEGHMTGSGYVDLDLTQGLPFRFNYKIDHCALIRQDYAEATASGDLVFSGNNQKAEISGILTLDEATINIPDEMPAHMKAVDVKYVNVPAASNSKIVLLDEKDDIPIHLNVTLNIPGQAYVLGRALTSEWSGSITFTGTTDHVLTNGELNLLSGDYIFNGRSLMGANGTIHFAGDPATKTTLYVTASQEIDEYHVEMILKGPVHDPVLAFRSNPPLSKKEILSLVLFNSKISEITPFQGAQLSQTVISLSDGMDKSDTLSRIRNSIGIDRIDISSVDTCDSNEVTIRVGKYISRGLFVSVNKSITADKNQVAIEANVTRHIKMKGEVGDDAEANLNLRWENQY